MRPVSGFVVVFLACAGLVACNSDDDGQSGDSGTCREFASLIETGYSEPAHRDFDRSTLEYSYTQKYVDTIQHVWTYASLEDFIEEGEQVNIGYFESYEFNQVPTTETREFDAEGRLLKSTWEADDEDGIETVVTEFDTWDDEGRPTRGYASRAWGPRPEWSCDLAEVNYSYDDDARQIVIETHAGTGGSEADCREGIARYTFDEYGNLLLEEFWAAGADIETDQPSREHDWRVRVLATEQVCL